MSSDAGKIFERIADSVDGTRGDRAIERDARADDRLRGVLVSRERVTIDRSYRGIAMRLSVPVAAYRGVCVGVRTGENGGFVYELSLAHRDPDLSVTLSEDRDESRIWADWRRCAGYFGLPALVARNDGPELCGALQAMGERHDRRVKRRHRPGIVTRRAPRPGAVETVHREDEIIARE